MFVLYYVLLVNENKPWFQNTFIIFFHFSLVVLTAGLMKCSTDRLQFFYRHLYANKITLLPDIVFLTLANLKDL